MHPNSVLSSIAIQINMLCRALDSQLNTPNPTYPNQSTVMLLDSNYLSLIYEALHLAIVSKNYSIILCLLHALQPLLQLAISKHLKLDEHVIKDLRSLVWMLVCSSTDNINRQIQRQACKVFVRGLCIFYPGSKEQSALLMVLLSESDSNSNGICMMREMLLAEMARKLADTKRGADNPNR
jgi:hypothetical protein